MGAAQRQRLSLGRAPALLLVVISVISSPGCGEETVEIPVTIRRDETTPCRATVQGQVRPMNTYWIDVFVFPGGAATDAGVLGCTDCSMSDRCALVPPRRCLCGQDRTPGKDELVSAISGARLADLSADGAYCVRVIALELPNPPCKCQLDGSDPPDVTQVRACAISTAATTLAEGASLSLDLSCLDDGDPGPSGLQACIANIPLPPPLP